MPRCERCPLRGLCPSRGRTLRAAAPPEPLRGLAPPAPRRARARARATGPRADGGYDRDVVDSLLADGLAVRRPDGLLALPEEVAPREHPRLCRERRQAVSRVQAGRALPGARRRAVRRCRRCGSATPRSRPGAASAACVVVPDAARPLRGAVRAASSRRWPRPTRSASGSRTSTTASSRRFRKPLYARAPRDRDARRLRRPDGSLDPRARDGGRLRRGARAARARLGARLAGATRVRVTTPGGTDCTFDVTGREWKVDDGVLDEPGAFGNLPAGEVFVGAARDRRRRRLRDRPLDRARRRGAGRRADPADVRARAASSRSRAAARPSRRARRSRRPARAPTSSPSSASARTSARASPAASSPTRRCSAPRTSRSATTRARATAATTAPRSTSTASWPTRRSRPTARVVFAPAPLDLDAAAPASVSSSYGSTVWERAERL